MKPYVEGIVVPLLGSEQGKEEDREDPNICPICLSNDPFTYKSWVMMRNCPHTFHRHCIDLWLESRPTCPLCMCNVYAAPPVDVNLPLNGCANVVIVVLVIGLMALVTWFVMTCGWCQEHWKF